MKLYYTLFLLLNEYDNVFFIEKKYNFNTKYIWKNINKYKVDGLKVNNRTVLYINREQRLPYFKYGEKLLNYDI